MDNSLKGFYIKAGEITETYEVSSELLVKYTCYKKDAMTVETRPFDTYLMARLRAFKKNVSWEYHSFEELARRVHGVHSWKYKSTSDTVSIKVIPTEDNKWEITQKTSTLRTLSLVDAFREVIFWRKHISYRFVRDNGAPETPKITKEFLRWLSV